MKREYGSRLLLSLVALAVLCVMFMASRQPMHVWMRAQGMCCYLLATLFPTALVPWLPTVARGAILAVVLLGSLVIARHLWQAHRFMACLSAASRRVTVERVSSLCAELGIVRQVVVISSPHLWAFCFGLLKPRIWISTGLAELLTEPELKAVLLHEEHHRRHFDPLRTLLVNTMTAALFFLPILAEWRDYFLTSLELAADRAAAQAAGRSALASALHTLLTHPLTMTHPSALQVSALSATHARLSHLLGDGAPAWHFSARSLAVSGAVLTVACFLL